MLKKKFGVGFRGEIQINQCIRDAAAAEKLGYGDCWISEDYYHGGAFSMATACAAETKKIKLGIGVLNPFTRHPALIAMEAAAINAYSNGRFMIGLGASNAVWIQQQMGIPYQKVLSMIRETIIILRGMFKGETVNFDGNMFHVSNVHLSLPVENIPIILGVKSENMLHLAAEQADGVLLSAGVSLPYIKWVKETIHAGAAAAGRNIDDFSISAYVLISIDKDRQKARELCKKRVSYFLGLHGYHTITKIAGMDEATLLPFREAFLKGETRPDLVTEEMIDLFSISGTPDECRSKLSEYMHAGITNPILFDFSHIPMTENMTMVKEYLFDLLDD